MEEKKVLFICTKNAGRSQMAEAFFNFYAREKNVDWIAESAGTFPADQVDPEVIEVMRDKGIDLRDASPKKYDPEKMDEYDKIISFGCLVKNGFEESVNKKIEEWIIDDPRFTSYEKAELIRDEIELKVIELINRL